jgi:hypothetical protein
MVTANILMPRSEPADDPQSAVHAIFVRDVATVACGVPDGGGPVSFQVEMFSPHRVMMAPPNTPSGIARPNA